MIGQGSVKKCWEVYKISMYAIFYGIYSRASTSIIQYSTL